MRARAAAAEERPERERQTDEHRARSETGGAKKGKPPHLRPLLMYTSDLLRDAVRADVAPFG
jgi:hypothetical protein